MIVKLIEKVKSFLLYIFSESVCVMRERNGLVACINVRFWLKRKKYYINVHRLCKLCVELSG